MIIAEEKFVCHECIEEKYLQATVFKKNLRICSYCDAEGEAISLIDLTEIIKKALDEHYYLTAEEPDTYELFRNKSFDRE